MKVLLPTELSHLDSLTLLFLIQLIINHSGITKETKALLIKSQLFTIYIPHSLYCVVGERTTEERGEKKYYGAENFPYFFLAAIRFLL